VANAEPQHAGPSTTDGLRSPVDRSAHLFGNHHRLIALVAPLLLIPTTFIVFQSGVAVLGSRWGYLAGFLFFWIFWCLAFPVGLLGWREVGRLFRPSVPRLPRPGWLWMTLLAVPVLGGFFTVWIPSLGTATVAALILAVGIAVINGTLEEILWRGLYAELFPGNWLAGWLYPALAFIAWHVSPTSVTGAGAPAFWFGTAFIGLVFGWVAYRTRSIRWTTVTHILVNSMGPGFAMLILYNA
jgi:uncharacterized protein